MGLYVGKSKQELQKENVNKLKKEVEKDAWISLKQYFDGAGNGAEAKIACVVVGTIARELQAKNNARQLDILEAKMGIVKKQLPEAA